MPAAASNPMPFTLGNLAVFTKPGVSGAVKIPIPLFREPTMSHADQHHRIDYLEFAVTSIEKAKTFYGQAFDWTFQAYGPDYCEFRDGRLTGGFYHGAPRSGGALVVLYSTDLEASQASIEKAGGRITRPIFDFPGGRRFHFTDPDGYELAVWSET